MKTNDGLANARAKQDILEYFNKNSHKMSLKSFDSYIEKYSNKYQLQYELKEEGLIYYFANLDVMELTSKGIQLVVESNYVDLFNAKLAEDNKQKDLQDKKDKTVINQYKLSEWQVKYYWIPFIVSGVSVAISIAALIFNYLKNK